VAGLDPSAVDQLLLFDHRQAEAGQVVTVGAVEAGHLRGLPTQQRAAAAAAAGRDALHHLRQGGGAELAGGDVIQEEQRFGAAGDHVVDAHRHQVDADAVVATMGLGQVELGADPVGARHQQGAAQSSR
jgi:hypothetical protein